MPIRVSAKALGELTLPDFCPRCFWIKRHIKTLPFQSFPSIFNDLDQSTKLFIHSWIDEYHELPSWLSKDLGPIEKYLESPSWRKLAIETQGILFSGSPDDIFVRPDSTLLVVDYKTARFTSSQDALFPIYEIQINGYAYLLEKHGIGRVTDLALVYMEPTKKTIDSAQGFRMEFRAHALKVGLDSSKVVGLIQKASDILYGGIPVGREKCKDCRRLVKVAKAI